MDEKAFAEQWKVVEEKYPLVAIRYLELINFPFDEWHHINSSFSAMSKGLSVCDPDSPIRATADYCERISYDPDAPIPFPNARPEKCKGASDGSQAEFERYIKCLKKRIP